MAHLINLSEFGMPPSIWFDELTPELLNAPRTTLSEVAIENRTELSETESGYALSYQGNFTFSYAPDGSVISVQGRVTSYAVLEWDPRWEMTQQWGFSITGFDVDLALFEGGGSKLLTRQIFAGDDLLEGARRWDDWLYGHAGDDELFGFGGRDVMDGGRGTDTLRGGKGDDYYYVDSVRDLALEDADGGYDWLISGIGGRLADHVEGLRLGPGVHAGSGNALDNQIEGNDQDNVLKGGGGADRIMASLGNDHLYGNQGADFLVGDAGSDIFFYTSAMHSRRVAADQIGDFVGGTDKVDVSGIDANIDEIGNQGFTFIGSDEFSAPGQLRFQYDRDTRVGTLYASTDSDGEPEFVVEFYRVSAMGAEDFVL